VNSNSIVKDKPWIAKDNDRPAAMEIRLLKYSLLLPWSQFLYAEGSEGEIRLTFATHEVVVRGASLGELLEDLSAHRVSLLREPARSDSFGTESGRQLRRFQCAKWSEPGESMHASRKS
jgi:hypothetical protein